ncbi:hypothetical protein MBLNU13_g03736t1 [Cladosporium sp. NU13]
MSGFKPVELFGGAITADFPATFGDVSNIRQVPDNQEVYLDGEGFASVVVEILEREEKLDNEALEYHLRDLVEDDEDDAAEKTKVWWTGEAVGGKLPPQTPTYNLLATSPPGAKQQGRANEPDFVAIMLTLIRLVDQKTDILVTVNVPHVIGQYDTGSVDLQHGKMGPLLEQAAKWRERVLETFEVKDWGLFGEE